MKLAVPISNIPDHHLGQARSSLRRDDGLLILALPTLRRLAQSGGSMMMTTMTMSGSAMRMPCRGQILALLIVHPPAPPYLVVRRKDGNHVELPKML